MFSCFLLRMLDLIVFSLIFEQEFSTKNKVLVTGTPLQNSVEELWYANFERFFFC